jgi:hypothetical protein
MKIEKIKSTVPEEFSEGALIRCKTTALCRKRQQATKPEEAQQRQGKIFG